MESRNGNTSMLHNSLAKFLFTHQPLKEKKVSLPYNVLKQKLKQQTQEIQEQKELVSSTLLDILNK